MNYFCHESSIIEKNVNIGKNTKIWHFCHISNNSEIEKIVIGAECLCGTQCQNWK